jgi:hypothetical protein
MGKYTKDMFKQEIFQKCIGKYDPIKIAKVTSTILFKNRADIDIKLEEKMLDLMTMEDGPEFEMTEEEFNQFLQKM